MKYVANILFSAFLFSQNTGSIYGVITDIKSGDKMPGVNVIVKGTYYGASSDMEGEYRIDNISPGSYDIEVSMIGYKVILKTGVEIKKNQAVTIDFNIEETVLSFGEDVVVLGKKPLFDIDETASVSRVRKEDIETKVVSSVEDILSEQIGVTTQDNEIHIRGGRIDESMFVVDGFSVKDPLSGYSGNLFVNADAIEELEIVTGGYSAEYGQAMSGIINIKLKEGRDYYEGAFKYSSDRLLNENFNSDRIEFNRGERSLISTPPGPEAQGRGHTVCVLAPRRRPGGDHTHPVPRAPSARGAVRSRSATTRAPLPGPAAGPPLTAAGDGPSRRSEGRGRGLTRPPPAAVARWPRRCSSWRRPRARSATTPASGTGTPRTAHARGAPRSRGASRSWRRS